LKRELLEDLLAHRAAKEAVVLVTRLGSGSQELLRPSAAAGATAPALHAAASEAVRRDRCVSIDLAGERVFLHPFNPPLRLVIVGAVHIAQPLYRMATEAGYEVSVVDPRKSFASEARFPGVTLHHEWPGQALRSLSLDSRSAVVTLTHDPKLDDPALAAALRSDAFYIGALGSRRTQAARRERLGEQGFGDAELGRIHGPVGLDIGAESPAEIAVSIVAELTQGLHQQRVDPIASGRGGSGYGLTEER
jgi:xanthine dehydrogenase accessory factor